MPTLTLQDLFTLETRAIKVAARDHSAPNWQALMNAWGLSACATVLDLCSLLRVAWLEAGQLKRALRTLEAESLDTNCECCVRCGPLGPEDRHGPECPFFVLNDLT